MSGEVQEYETVISIELHVQLATRTKLFCRCEVAYGREPNSCVCPVCLGFPGSLPVLNNTAVELAVRTALALNCAISEHSAFDRKNYFYPDLPKSYQITQHYFPIGTGGRLEIEAAGKKQTVTIERVHLEEDAGKIVYSEETGESLLDFNRCGTPLLEIVTVPWVTTPGEVYEYLTAIKQLLQYIEISDCDMEKGNLRCDCNISVMPRGSKDWGTRTEIKNLNSFRAAQKALEYERERHVRVLESGDRVRLETMLWDDTKGITYPRRSKEEAHDYRYFPEPDLPPVILRAEGIDAIKKTMPELPAARRHRFTQQYGLPAAPAGVLTADRQLADFYEHTLEHYDRPRPVANWMTGSLLRELNERGTSLHELNLSPEHAAAIVRLLDTGIITNVAERDILPEVLDTGDNPDLVVERSGLSQDSDEGDLRNWARQAIADNPKAVDDYASGKKTAAQFIVGQAMKLSRGRANPKKLLEVVSKLLDSSSRNR
jgi:aspartyl-tRNA(Asn)/glutamyl-tRNA(Gln) amidotransferase subunit B